LLAVVKKLYGIQHNHISISRYANPMSQYMQQMPNLRIKKSFCNRKFKHFEINGLSQSFTLSFCPFVTILLPGIIFGMPLTRDAKNMISNKPAQSIHIEYYYIMLNLQHEKMRNEEKATSMRNPI